LVRFYVYSREFPRFYLLIFLCSNIFFIVIYIFFCSFDYSYWKSFISFPMYGYCTVGLYVGGKRGTHLSHVGFGVNNKIGHDFTRLRVSRNLDSFVLFMNWASWEWCWEDKKCYKGNVGWVIFVYTTLDSSKSALH
jgi:hypothetical protein